MFKKKRDALLPLLFSFASDYAIRMFQINQDGLKLNGTYQHFIYADVISILGKRV